MSLVSESGVDIPLRVTDNVNGTFSVDYVVTNPGLYTANISYGGKAVPQSPIKIQVQPHIDISKIKVDGLEPSMYKMRTVFI